jgi:predicted DNA-binding transcriptional regulator AlpA
MLKAQRPQPEGTGGAVGDSAQNHSTAPVEPPTTADLLAELVKIRWALERPAVDRLTLRANELEASLGLSKRLIQKEVSAGRFPRPVKIGRVSVWPVEVVREFLAQAAVGRRSRS